MTLVENSDKDELIKRNHNRQKTAKKSDMDSGALSYHNKVQDWSQMYMLAADGNVYKNSKLVTYLPPQKLHQIENWRKDVSKNLRPKSSQFPKLHTPRADALHQRASSALVGRNKMQLNSRRQIWSASSGNLLYSGTNLDSVTHHLAETSLHYAAQRENLHQVNSFGKQLLKINKKQVQLIDSENTETEVSEKIDKTSKQASLNSEGEADHTSDNIDTDEEGSDTISSISRMAGRGTVINVHDQMMIQVRSQSNHLLNVISIDDCKKMCPNIYHKARLKVESKKAMYEQIAEETLDKEDKEEESVCSKETNIYAPTTSKSVAECRNQIKDRTAKISKAIDEMVHERKVMNNMDRNFDARIEATGGRIILDRGEGGATFRRLNSALRRHVNSVASHQGHKQINSWNKEFLQRHPSQVNLEANESAQSMGTIDVVEAENIPKSVVL